MTAKRFTLKRESGLAINCLRGTFDLERLTKEFVHENVYQISFPCIECFFELQRAFAPYRIVFYNESIMILDGEDSKKCGL